MQLVLDRYHGLGNDYLVLVEGPPLHPELVRQICDRHTGVGGDGILAPASSTTADHGVRIWNPDGSIAEKSGNGLRIFARWLVDEGRAGRSFSVDTGACRVTCDVGEVDIAVDMGRVSFAPEDVPVRAPGPLLDGWIDGVDLPVCAVGLGNPHCVLFVDDPDGLDWRALGRQIEVHPAFPNRTNVQVATVLGPGRALARIWERGAGETSASGSSACAVASAAVRTGRLGHGLVTVEMAGGSLSVEVSEAWDIRLVGPVERVGRVHVDAGWLRSRAGRRGD